MPTMQSRCLIPQYKYFLHPSARPSAHLPAAWRCTQTWTSPRVFRMYGTYLQISSWLHQRGEWRILMEHNTPQFDQIQSNNTCPAWEWTLQFQCSIEMSTSRQCRPNVISILLLYKIHHKLHVRISFNIIPSFSKYNLKKN